MKGQIEMMGLVIVMVLLVIGGLFYLAFVVLPSGDEEQEVNVVRSIQANNLMNALIKIDVCGNLSVGEVLSDCNYGVLACDMDACEFLDKEIPDIVSSATYRDFRFEVSKGNNVFFESGECKNGISSGIYSFIAQNERFDAQFWLC